MNGLSFRVKCVGISKELSGQDSLMSSVTLMKGTKSGEGVWIPANKPIVLGVDGDNTFQVGYEYDLHITAVSRVKEE